MKPIRYTRHAEAVMRERGLEKQWIEETVHVPEWSVAETEQENVEGRFRRIPQRDHRVLRVIVMETPVDIRIISAFFDRQAMKPLRVAYDPEADAAYIRFSKGQAVESHEVSPWNRARLRSIRSYCRHGRSERVCPPAAESPGPSRIAFRVLMENHLRSAP